MTSDLVLAAALAAASVGAQAPAPVEVPAVVPAVTEPQPQVAAPAQWVLPKGTMVRLMVTKEVNSRDTLPGSRFALRVDEAVAVGGTVLIPVGSKAWGEIVSVERSGSAGKSGAINTRLLYIDVAGRRVDLDGDRQSSGSGGTGQVVAGIVAFGPLGLLMKGNNATLKAGEIINGYTRADVSFDPPAPAQ